MFKLFWNVINEFYNEDLCDVQYLYSIEKKDSEYQIRKTFDWTIIKMIDEDTMIKLHTIYIQNKMKDERDFFELEIKWVKCIILRFKWHLNWYVVLPDDEDIDDSSIDVHWWITFRWTLKELETTPSFMPCMIPITAKLIWFDTAHAGDAFIHEVNWMNMFEYTLKNWEYRDYQFVYNELVKLVNQLPKEMLTTDWQRYFKNFVQEVKDFSNLSEVEFFMKYCLSWEEEHDIKKEYESYSKYEMQEDELSYEEWLEEVYYEDNQDTIIERVREYREPWLDFIEYKDSNSDNSIYEITLARWWPNVYLTINTRWQSVLYEFIWWWERLSEDLSYLYDEIISYFNIY